MGTLLPSRSAIPVDEALKLRIEELARANGLTPPDLVREAVEEFAVRRNGGAMTAPSESVWDIAARVSESVADEEWAGLPRDLARNFKHHHYGHPRED